MLRALTWLVAPLLWAGSPVLSAELISPGEWEATVTVVDASIKGGPAGLGSALGAGTKTTRRYCITAEQAAQGPQEMLRENGSCQMNGYSIANGRVSGRMTCSQNRARVEARFSGSYTPTSFQVTSNATVTGPMIVQISASNRGRRIGPCTGG